MSNKTIILFLLGFTIIASLVILNLNRLTNNNFFGMIEHKICVPNMYDRKQHHALKSMKPKDHQVLKGVR